MKSAADVRQPAPAAAEGEPKSSPKRIPSPFVKRGVRAEAAQPPASPARSILAVAQNTFRRSDGAARKGDIRMASGAVITKDQLRKLVARPPQQHKWVLMPDSPLHRAWVCAPALRPPLLGGPIPAQSSSSSATSARGTARVAQSVSLITARCVGAARRPPPSPRRMRCCFA